MKDRAKNYAKQQLKKAITKKLMAIIGPYILPIILVLLLIFMMSVLVISVFMSMTPGGYMTGVEPSEEDAKWIHDYKLVAAAAQKDLKFISKVDDKKKDGAYNIRHMYYVDIPRDKDEDGNDMIPIPDIPFYDESNPAKNTMARRIGDNFPDNAAQVDFRDRLKWGDLHSVRLYYMYYIAVNEMPKEREDLEPSNIGKDFQPYFYYETDVEHHSWWSKDHCCDPDKDNCSSSDSWSEDKTMTVESQTIQGWYQYSYIKVIEEKTETIGCIESYNYDEYWKLLEQRSVIPDRYERIHTYIREKYEGLEDNVQEDIVEARIWILEGASGFTEKAEWLSWLLESSWEIFNGNISGILGKSSIPPEYMMFLEEAEAQTCIPWWLMSGLVMKESSFNHMAVNSDSGRFGLTQQHPKFWENRWKAYGFELNQQWDPMAQIMVGAYLLRDRMKDFGVDPCSINWEDESQSWKNDKSIQKAFASYGEYDLGADGKYDNAELQRAYDEYIGSIYQIADAFNSDYGYPFENAYPVSQHFKQHGNVITHHGVDLAAPKGTPILAIASGIAITVAHDGDGTQWSGYGNTLIIDSATIGHRYAHMISMTIQQNQVVKKGQVIGYVGMTGIDPETGELRSSGNHLHLEVWEWQPDGTKRFKNPLNYIKHIG